ncbi:hypothetical protein EDD17DRAFT_52427 [Pisolithus thermaeus]|nr:hypothetical protein EDD17DRAFT_52427 [Pisolithus thermaeus]
MYYIIPSLVTLESPYVPTFSMDLDRWEMQTGLVAPLSGVPFVRLGVITGLYVSTASYYYALFDNRFTMSDVAIHTRDVMNGMGHDRNDDESNLGPHGRLRGETCQHFVEEIRKNVKSNLENATAIYHFLRRSCPSSRKRHLGRPSTR